MNCMTCQNELEDFLYGELDETRAQSLRVHLRGCAECAQVQAALEREQEVFTQYYEQTAPEPSDALWQAIQTRIQTEAPAPLTARVAAPALTWWQRMFSEVAWLRQIAFATALVLVSVAATTVYFKWQGQTQPTGTDLASKGGTSAPQPSPTASAPTAAVTPTSAPLEREAPKAEVPREQRPAQPQPKLTDEQLMQNQLARAEREYQHAIKLLDRVIARRQDKLDPAVRQQYESSLALIDNSIAESRRALRANPDNAVSGQFLLAAYAKKLDLMRDIAMNAGQ